MKKTKQNKARKHKKEHKWKKLVLRNIVPNFHETKTVLSKTSIANQQNESQSTTEAN